MDPRPKLLNLHCRSRDSYTEKRRGRCFSIHVDFDARKKLAVTSKKPIVSRQCTPQTLLSPSASLKRFDVIKLEYESLTRARIQVCNVGKHAEESGSCHFENRKEYRSLARLEILSPKRSNSIIAKISGIVFDLDYIAHKINDDQGSWFEGLNAQLWT